MITCIHCSLPFIAASNSLRVVEREALTRFTASISRCCRLDSSDFLVFSIIFNRIFSNNESFILQANSLEDFLFDIMADDPKAAHLKSPEAYIQWGRRRNLEIVSCERVLPFTGRDDVINNFVDHAMDILLQPTLNSPIRFMQASPGVGKTRLLNEIVSMNDDLKNRQVAHLQIRSNDQVNI